MIAFTAKIFSSLQTMFGLEPEGRRLTEHETAELNKVFNGTIDPAKILIKEGRIGAMGASKRAFTLCDTIYIPGTDGAGFGAPGTDGYLRLLVHESTHVWQFQNGGTDYITGSLKEQTRGWWSGKGTREAYQYEQGIKEGKAWAELNPEQQARLIEDSYASGLFGYENARLTGNDGEDYTDYARTAITELLARRGAP
jgi:hypothetical protein